MLERNIPRFSVNDLLTKRNRTLKQWLLIRFCLTQELWCAIIPISKCNILIKLSNIWRKTSTSHWLIERLWIRCLKLTPDFLPFILSLTAMTSPVISSILSWSPSPTSIPLKHLTCKNDGKDVSFVLMRTNYNSLSAGNTLGNTRDQVTLFE